MPLSRVALIAQSVILALSVRHAVTPLDHAQSSRSPVGSGEWHIAARGNNRSHRFSHNARLCTFINSPQNHRNGERDGQYLPSVHRDHGLAAHAPTQTCYRSPPSGRVQVGLGATRLLRRVAPRRSTENQAEADCRSTSAGASADWHRQNHEPRSLPSQDPLSSPRRTSQFATVWSSSE